MLVPFVSNRLEAELRHIRMHAVELPFAESGTLSIMKLTDNPS